MGYTMYGLFWQDWFHFDSLLDNLFESGLSWDVFFGLLVDAYFDYDGENWYEDYEEQVYEDLYLCAHYC